MNSDIIIYKNPDGSITIDVRLEEENVWLTQDQMATLFSKAKSTINEHIKNIYEEQELLETVTMKKFGNSEFLCTQCFFKLTFFKNILNVLING